MRLSNRLVAVLVLLGCFAFVGALGYWFFVANSGSIAVTTDSGSGTVVSVLRDGVPLYEKPCESSCRFDNVPAIALNVRATASGYAARSVPVAVPANGVATVELKLVRSAVAEAIDSKQIEDGTIVGPIDANLASGSEAPAENATGSANLGSGSVEAGTGLLSTRETFSVTKSPFEIRDASGTLLYSRTGGDPVDSYRIDSGEGFVSFFARGTWSVYDAAKNTVTPIPSFPSDETIVAVRRTPKADRWIIAGAKESFFYDLGRASLLTHPFFTDFTFVDPDRIIGIIKAGDKDRWNRYGEKSPGTDAVVLQNLATNESRVVYSGRSDLARIEDIGGEILLIAADGSILHLKNIE